MNYDILRLCCEFDAGSERFDDNEAPPGWATRNHVSVRIISRKEAYQSAIRTAIIYFLQHPTYIWANQEETSQRKVLTDVFIELSRAYPSLIMDRKYIICEALRRFVPQILREMIESQTVALLNADFPSPLTIDQNTDFYFVLKNSKLHPTWDEEKCAHCHANRYKNMPIIIMHPCGHTLCSTGYCFKEEKSHICPICARDNIENRILELDLHSDVSLDCRSNVSLDRGSDVSPDCKSDESRDPKVSLTRGYRAICIDISLHIPSAIIKACWDWMRE